MKGVNQPRLRVNRSAGLSLTTAWQDVAFTGTSNVNVNTFGKDPASNNPLVHYDTSTNLFRFYEQYDINYNVTMYIKTTATIVGTGTTMQYRLVVPNGGGQGVDSSFPFPDADGYADIANVAMKIGGVMHTPVIIPMYLSNNIRTNGVKLQLRLSEALVGIGNVTVNHIAILIQQ